ncbi:MAG: hypothetical protein IPL59_17700 [Candidatus Competibacteraceae bacterium]|nr:hypothetical protein [Candidatus Competibacteraceae bacterium]
MTNLRRCNASGDGFGRTPDRNPAGIADWPGAWPAVRRYKEAAMTAFKAGNLDLLVATTVIEVGVDVPTPA